MVLRMETGGCDSVVIMKDISFILLPRVKILKYVKTRQIQLWQVASTHPLCWGPGYWGRWVRPSPDSHSGHQQLKEPPDPLWLKWNWKSDEDRENKGTLPISLCVPFTEVSYLYYKNWTEGRDRFFSWTTTTLRWKVVWKCARCDNFHLYNAW